MTINLIDRTIFFLGGFETKMVGPFYMKNARTDGVWVWHNLLAVTSLNGIADPQRKRVIYTTVRVTELEKSCYLVAIKTNLFPDALATVLLLKIHFYTKSIHETLP